MPRYYVEKDGEWNIFSTITDDFLFAEFICLDALMARILYERFKELTEDIESLLSDSPKVNVMSYEEAIEHKRIAKKCNTCRWADVADEHCEICGVAGINNYELQTGDET